MTKATSYVTLALGAGVLWVGIIGYLFFAFAQPAASTFIKPHTAPADFSKSPPAHVVVPSIPTRLIIPKLQVDALVQSVGLVDGAMGVPTNFTDVAWYTGSVRPGLPGSAVIDGHRSGKKVPHGVFFDLKQLIVGDIVQSVDSNGATSTFLVTAVKSYAYDAATDAIFTATDNASHLNLITCSGVWNKDSALFSERIVVFTTLVE